MRDPEELFEELDAIEDECLQITGDALGELQTRWESVVSESQVGGELDAELAKLLRARTTEVGLHFLSVLHELDKGAEAQLFPAKLVDIAPSSEMRELVRACERDVPNFLRLYQAKREIYVDGGSHARTVLKEVQKSSSETVLQKAAQSVLDLPQPINSAPALFSLNGFGVGMYGSRDRIGSTVIKTHSICMLFVPVMPLAAYRVESTGDGYYFLSKDKLSAFARGYRALALLTIVGLIAFSIISSYLNNPGRRFEQAMDEAQDLSTTTDRETQIARYEAIISDFRNNVSATDLQRAASALVPLYLADVPDPLTPDELEKAEIALVRFHKLIRIAQSGTPSQLLSKTMIAWAKALDGPEMDQRVASLNMLRRAQALQLGNGEAARVVSEAYQLQRVAIAGTLAQTRPLDAVDFYLEMGALRLLEASDLLLKMNLSQFLSASGQRTRWKRAATTASTTAARTAIEERETVANALAQSDEALLEVVDESALSALVNSGEASQAVRVALAELKLSQGLNDEAIEILLAIGSHGEMTLMAQQLLSQCYSAAGRIEDADALIDSYLNYRLGRFQNVSVLYNEAANTLVDRLYNDAQQGNMPSSIESELNELSDEDAQKKRFGEWVQERLSADNDVATLRKSYEEYGDVVSMVLQQGMVKLELASTASGEERNVILAEAERSFLAIATEAAGAPQYHLNLGEVYYRLGKVAEGDNEFESLLGQQDSQLTLMVAQVYRGLGLRKRAKEAAEAVWELKTQPFEAQAAQLMVVLSSELDDKEKWLKRGDQKSESVQIGLLDVQAERAVQEGREKDADKLFAKIVKRHLAQNGAGGLNNAALANMRRYTLTGKIEQLDSARSDMEKALRQIPNEPIVTHNLSSLANQHGGVQILSSWIKIEIARPSGSDTNAVLGYLLEGPLRDTVLDKVQKNSSIRLSRSLAKQLQILSPQSEYGWLSEANWMTWNKDAEALQSLYSRVEPLIFDDSESEDSAKKYVAGELDEELIAASETTILGLEKQLSEARAAKHDPTIATVLLFLGHILEDQASLTRSVEQAQKSLEYFRESAKRWPELALEDDIIRGLVNVALFRAVKGDVELETFWDRELRTYGFRNAFLGEEFEVVRAKLVALLKKEPEFAQGIALALKQAKVKPTPTQWVLGKISGDSELLNLSKSSLSEAHRIGSYRISQHLAPTSKSAKRTLSIAGG